MNLYHHWRLTSSSVEDRSAVLLLALAMALLVPGFSLAQTPIVCDGMQVGTLALRRGRTARSRACFSR